MPMNEVGLREEIAVAINRVSAENGSNTPDFILADYLVKCLAAFDSAANARDAWYGVRLRIGSGSGEKCAHSPPDPTEPTIGGELTRSTERGPA